MKKKETIQLENCRLCGEEKELKKSHIIPRFFYKHMEWHEKNFRYQILGIHSYYKIIRQGGIKEKLLCKECEQIFSCWENYVNKTLYGGVESSIRNLSNRKWLVSGLDYNKFKLFQLSVLWRASISNQEFFKSVNLGEKHESQIKEMLKNQNPGPPEKYACILIAVMFDRKPIKDLMINPTPIRQDNHRVYRFVFGGFAWAYFVSSHFIPEVVRHVTINESGEMIISALEVHRLGMITGLINNLKING